MKSGFFVMEYRKYVLYGGLLVWQAVPGVWCLAAGIWYLAAMAVYTCCYLLHPDP